MEIESKYNPQSVEDRWYSFWEEHKLFHSEPDGREPYTVVIPPPNVTGVLHMGHMLNNTIQDVLVRRARMLGKNACWVPGTDHASIATEAKVVNRLKEQGIDKHSLTREQFMDYAYQWKDEHGGIILQQLRKLGASCDWERTAFTMDSTRYNSVIHVFVDLYRKGLIYRGARMVNWDPKALTAVSDEEVIYKESHSKLFYLRYHLDDGAGKPLPEYIVVATTRPETIIGDTAVCVHPDDPRYAHLKGRRLIVPSIGRSVPVIMDEYVDREFGTGALKITPAHDVNDYNLGLKYQLESINIFNDDATLNEAAGRYAGLDRFECRRQIMDVLQASNLVEKVEDYVNKVGHSERTDAVIEPKLSTQWFLKMDGLASKALEAVESGRVQFHPDKFRNTYRHWLENIKDWCISRQLWWGQRIPAYYYDVDGKTFTVVAESLEEALALAQADHPSVEASMLRQDDDVLDTWFSSWLWPMSLFNGILSPDNKEINYYFPTADLVTAPDIIFFWVARMIMASEEYRGVEPFKHVYFTGIVRDKLGRKMSKSLGNSPDPIGLIERYGADGVRMGMLLTAPAGNDLPFDEALCEQGRNFANKLWNALRLVKGWQQGEIKQPAASRQAVEWIEQRMAQVIGEVNSDFESYRLSEALMKIYKLVWDDFCSWYLEIVKPAYGQPIDGETLESTLSIFERLMLLLHPFMPFLTEEVWHLLRQRCDCASIMVQPWPEAVYFDERTLSDFATAQAIVTSVRALRTSQGLSPREPLKLYVRNMSSGLQRFCETMSKLANLELVASTSEKVDNSSAFMVGAIECYVPLSTSVDTAAELQKLQADLKYTEGFLASVMKKLQNEKFVNGAPEAVVVNERKKQADAEQKIAALKEQIAMLSK